MAASDEMVERLALAAVHIENEIDASISHPGPLLMILSRAREEAAIALQSMVDMPLDGAVDIDRMRLAQWEVKRMRNLADWVAEAVAAGKEAWHSLNPETQREYAALMAGDGEAKPAAGGQEDD